MKFEDYYSVLDVPPTASQDELQSAFRKLARKYHPDVSKEPDAEEQFKRVNEAYEVLKDPETRQCYDRLGEHYKSGQDFRPPPGWGGAGQGFGGQQVNIEDLFGQQAGGFSDFFKNFMGGAQAAGSPYGGGQRSPRQRTARPVTGTSREASAAITLEQLYEGASLTVSATKSDGSSKSYSVKIPPGSLDGSVIRLGGQGEPGRHGGKAGDLLLRLQLQPHPVFEVSGYDLSAAVPITPWEAALGAKVSAPTLAGEVTLTIPAGVVGASRMRLKGKGLPGKSGKRGDLYLRLDLVNPPKLSDEQRELYEQLAGASEFDPRA